MFKVILWDIDGTLLDFKAAEKAAFYKCFEVTGLEGCSDEMLQRYSTINHTYWERLERNEITKQEVLEGRYIEFMTKELELASKGESTFKITNKADARYGTIEAIARAFNDEYQIRLGDTAIFCDDGEQLVKDFGKKYKQYIVTNGTAIAQHRKLKTSGLENLVDGWFISDEIGIEKPNIGFFEAVWEKIGTFEKDEVVIIGDSLTSDMKGGNNANITTCWYNPNHLSKRTDIEVDYEISNLQELRSLL